MAKRNKLLADIKNLNKNDFDSFLSDIFTLLKTREGESSRLAKKNRKLLHLQREYEIVNELHKLFNIDKKTTHLNAEELLFSNKFNVQFNYDSYSTADLAIMNAFVLNRFRGRPNMDLDFLSFYKLVLEIVDALPVIEEEYTKNTEIEIKKVELQYKKKRISIESTTSLSQKEEIVKKHNEIIKESLESREEYLDKLLDLSTSKFSTVYNKLSKTKKVSKKKNDEYKVSEKREQKLEKLLESSFSRYSEVYKNLA